MTGPALNWNAPREFRGVEVAGIIRGRKEAARVCDGFRHVMSELGFPQNMPSPILEDNESAIKLSKNPVKAGRSKHIDIHNHFLRQSVKNGDVVLVPVDTKINPADIGTKSLAVGPGRAPSEVP